MATCVFCDIVGGRAPARTVYRDDHVVGFLDIRPVTRGHTLLIPREHSSGLADLDPDMGGRLFAAGQRVAAAMKSGALGADGVNLVVNDGRAAFQTVFHTHLHVVPRHNGDKLSFAKGLVVRRDPDPDQTAELLRVALEPDHR
ncbi:HIT family protein [Gordonia hankookensis]|uniref:HIT family protein n=1 Tax=Gordonia hankookensis TaxID=589403 RepID=A0ABR7WGK0_9ACTN|nr:HIT family protein [Gordonia hankookensis]MBD1321583.1 HIT family protein [Gordonia hankookensis]NDZ93181.1 HIT family protein [Streptomyces sp. SID11726]NDZ94778.1 HIT family protein [Streptomyces sp. SID11726]NEB22938.1 HIT family protein [Streptomyces sp. SID6673]